MGRGERVACGCKIIPWPIMPSPSIGGAPESRHAAFLLARRHFPAILCCVGAKAVLETAVVDGGASVNGATIAADSRDTNGAVSAALGSGYGVGDGDSCCCCCWCWWWC